MTKCPIGYVCPSEASLMQLSNGGAKAGDASCGVGSLLGNQSNGGSNRECSICQIEFETPSAYRQHAVRAHKECIYPGGTASNVIFSSREDALATKELHLAYLCPVLTCKYSSAQKLKQHFFISVTALRQHFGRCHMERRFKCSYCAQVFGSQRECSIHLRSCKLAPPSVDVLKDGTGTQRQFCIPNAKQCTTKPSVAAGNGSVHQPVVTSCSNVSSQVKPKPKTFSHIDSSNGSKTLSSNLWDSNLGTDTVPPNPTRARKLGTHGAARNGGNLDKSTASNGTSAIKKVVIHHLGGPTAVQPPFASSRTLSIHAATIGTNTQKNVIKEDSPLYSLIKESVELKRMGFHPSHLGSGGKGSFSRDNNTTAGMINVRNVEGGAGAQQPLKIVLKGTLSSPTSLSSAVKASLVNRSPPSGINPSLNVNSARYFGTSSSISSNGSLSCDSSLVNSNSNINALRLQGQSNGTSCYASFLASAMGKPFALNNGGEMAPLPNNQPTVVQLQSQASDPTTRAPNSSMNATSVAQSLPWVHQSANNVSSYVTSGPDSDGNIDTKTMEVLRKMNKVPTSKQLLLLQRSLAKSRKKQLVQQATRRQYQVELDNAKDTNTMLDTIISKYRPIQPTQHRQSSSPRKLLPKSTIASKIKGHTRAKGSIVYSLPRTSAAVTNGGSKDGVPCKSQETEKFLQGLSQHYRDKRHTSLVSFATQTVGRVRHGSARRTLKRKLLKATELEPTLSHNTDVDNTGLDTQNKASSPSYNIVHQDGYQSCSTNNGNPSGTNPAMNNRPMHNFNASCNVQTSPTGFVQAVGLGQFNNPENVEYNANNLQHQHNDQQQQTVLPKMIDRGFSADPPAYFPNYDARGTNTAHVEYTNQSINTTPYQGYGNYHSQIDKPCQVSFASPDYTGSCSSQNQSDPFTTGLGSHGDMNCQTSPSGFFHNAVYSSMTTQTLQTPPLIGGTADCRDQPIQSGGLSMEFQPLPPQQLQHHQHNQEPVRMEDAAVMVSGLDTQRYLGLVSDNWTNTTDMFGYGADNVIDNFHEAGAIQHASIGLQADGFSPLQAHQTAASFNTERSDAGCQPPASHYANFGTNTAHLSFNDQWTNTTDNNNVISFDNTGFSSFDTTPSHHPASCLNTPAPDIYPFNPKQDAYSGPNNPSSQSDRGNGAGSTVSTAGNSLLMLDVDASRERAIISDLDQAAAQLAADIAHNETQTEYPFDLAAFLNDDGGEMVGPSGGEQGEGPDRGSQSRGRIFEHLLNTAETQTTGCYGGFLECLMATAETQTLDATPVS